MVRRISKGTVDIKKIIRRVKGQLDGVDKLLYDTSRVH